MIFRKVQYIMVDFSLSLLGRMDEYLNSPRTPADAEEIPRTGYSLRFNKKWFMAHESLKGMIPLEGQSVSLYTDEYGQDVIWLGPAAGRDPQLCEHIARDYRNMQRSVKPVGQHAPAVKALRGMSQGPAAAKRLDAEEASAEAEGSQGRLPAPPSSFRSEERETDITDDHV